MIRPEHLKRGVSIVLGGALVGLGGWYSWQYYQDAAAPLAIASGAIMLHLAEHCWHERQRVRAVAMLLCALGAAAISAVAVVDRVSATRDTAARAADDRNLARAHAAAGLSDAQRELDAEADRARAECARATVPGANPRGPACAAAEAREERARERRDAARAAVVAAGSAETSDPGARRLAAVLPVTEAQIRLYAPLMLPLWVELAGLVLLSFGLSRTRRPAEPRALVTLSDTTKGATPPPAAIEAPKAEPVAEPKTEPAELPEVLGRLRAMATDGQLVGTQRELARKLGVPVARLNRAIADASRAGAVRVDTSRNATALHFH